ATVAQFSELSRTVAEIANLALPLQQPFVGYGAFAHKGGQHVAAVLKHKDAYQHIDPAVVGNEARVLVSELSGRGNVLAKAREFGLELDRDDPQTRWLVQHLKDLEHQGYSYEAADASFEMLVRRLQRWTTVGGSRNIIEASLLALVESLEYVVSRRVE